MITDVEYSPTLPLPAPRSTFYAARKGQTIMGMPLLPTLDEFNSSAPTPPIGANGYLCALAQLLDRATRFRADCEERRVSPFGEAGAPGGCAGEIEADGWRWFNRLPEKARRIGSVDGEGAELQGWMWNPQWIEETYDWGINMVVFHATMALLHGEIGPDLGPSSNLLKLANELISHPGASPHPRPDPTLTVAPDALLFSWYTSQSFNTALSHTRRGISVLSEMTARVPPTNRRDTPFYGFAVRVLGLVELFAAREIMLAGGGATAQEHLLRVAVPVAALGSQRALFGASRLGERLLQDLFTEIAGWEMTPAFVDGMRERGGQALDGVEVERLAMGRSEGYPLGKAQRGAQAFAMLH
ncbi:hypothetical protein BDK51DRAFT_41112 [Blyttiomyces helicus]|uniref:Uncharacterized protein n=1 Tax=Blyttiomyces helicus TaxID=388810 RepID=A0A4P9WKH0_9FUNG|nr:hypothetical protein BDK51DRAFT_41112 [Blyttiomyces helicus]|eukprot:RKO92068.1 hypothetical protein BDK51DRAFT_41112 [Blyttiomyces helicus]